MLTASRNKNFLQSKFQIFHDFSTLKMMSSFFGKINLECTVCVFLIDSVFDRVCRYLHDSARNRQCGTELLLYTVFSFQFLSMVFTSTLPPATKYGISSYSIDAHPVLSILFMCVETRNIK